MSDARWRAGTRRQTAQLAERRHDVGRRLVEGQAIVFGHVAEPGPHTDRVAPDVETAHLDVPLRRVREAEEQAKRRRLSRTVGSDQADTPARHVDRQVIERGRTRITLGQSVETK